MTVEKEINGSLTTYQDCSMSLSCRGNMEIKNGIVTSANYKGYPRARGDSWFGFYKKAVGDRVTAQQVENILSFNRNYDVVSKFKPVTPKE